MLNNPISKLFLRSFYVEVVFSDSFGTGERVCAILAINDETNVHIRCMSSDHDIDKHFGQIGRMFIVLSIHIIPGE